MSLGSYSHHAAGVLAKTIETYWRERGHGNVRAERYELDGFPNHWGVRSNLVNGLPPK